MQGFYNTESTRQVSTESEPDTTVCLTDTGRAVVAFGEPGRAPVNQAKPDGAAPPKVKGSYELGRRVLVGRTSQEGVIIEKGVSSPEQPGRSNLRRVLLPSGRRRWYKMLDLAPIDVTEQRVGLAGVSRSPISAISSPVQVSSRDLHDCVRNWRTRRKPSRSANG